MPSATCCAPAASRVYFPGDTDLFAEMGALAPIDVALLPIWGWGPTIGEGHLDPDRAVQATELIGPGLVVPIHWGTFSPLGLRRGRPQWVDEPVHRFREALERAGAERPPAGTRARWAPRARAADDPRAMSERSELQRHGAFFDAQRRSGHWCPVSSEAAARRMTRWCTSDQAGGRPPPALRPAWTQVLGRGLAVIILAALTLWLLAWLLDGFDIDRPQDALLAGLVVGVVNAVVWPALAVSSCRCRSSRWASAPSCSTRCSSPPCWTSCPASRSPGSGRRWPWPSGWRW